jgi:hypothetical protein
MSVERPLERLTIVGEGSIVARGHRKVVERCLDFDRSCIRQVVTPEERCKGRRLHLVVAFATPVVGKGVGRVVLIEREPLWDSSFGAALVLFGYLFLAERMRDRHYQTPSRVSLLPMVRSLSRPVRF